MERASAALSQSPAVDESAAVPPLRDTRRRAGVAMRIAKADTPPARARRPAIVPEGAETRPRRGQDGAKTGAKTGQAPARGAFTALSRQ